MDANAAGCIGRMRGTTCVFVCVALTACGRIEFAPQPAIVDAGDAPSSIDADLRAYPERVRASGPFAYYRLDEPSGGTVADASGQGNDGSCGTQGGTITYGRPGALSTATDLAMRFDGDGNAGPNPDASCGIPIDESVWDGAFTVELFVLPHSVPPTFYSHAIFICENYLVDGFRFVWNIDGSIQAYTTQGGSTGNTMSAPDVIAYGAWQHLAVVREANTFSIYRDGALVVAGDADYVPATQAAECGFGAFHGNPTDATLDEVAIYGRALTQAELATHLAGR